MSATSNFELCVPVIVLFLFCGSVAFVPEKIERAPDRRQVLSRNVEIDHGGLNRLVPHEHLDLADVVAHLEKMGGEAMAIMPSTA